MSLIFLETKSLTISKEKIHTVSKRISFIEDSKNGTGGAVLSAEEYVTNGSEPFLFVCR